VSQYKSPVPDNQTPEVTPVEAIPPQPVAAPGSQDLSTQIEALRAKNAELIGERRKDKEARDTLQNQLDQLAQAQQEAKTQKLAETGEYRTLWEEAQQTVADLKQQITQRDATIEEIRTGFTKEQVRATAVAQLVAGWCSWHLISCIVYCRRTYAPKKDSLWLLSAASKFQLASISPT
jgi:hypothetical protein